MKVSVVVPGYARRPSGGISVVYKFANGLVERGHEVSIVHVALYRRPAMRDAMPRRQLEEVVSGWRDVRRGPPRDVGWAPVDERVRRTYVPVLRRDCVPDGDAVLATAWQTALPVAALPRSKGRGCYLIQGHEIWSGTPRRVDETWRLPLRKVFIARWLLQRAASMGLSDIHHVPLAIDTDKFTATQPIGGRSPRVAMLAAPGPWKGLADGVEALERARRAMPDLQAVLFGVRSRPAQLPGWIEYHQDPPQTVLVDEIYNRASIYLCPSRLEGWHLPPAEAMACGVAVVTTDIGGVADYAHHDETALLSPVGDATRLTDNLLRLLADEKNRVRLAREGHRRIHDQSWERSVQAFIRVLDSRDPMVMSA